MKTFLFVAFLFCLTSPIANANQFYKSNKPIVCGPADKIVIEIQDGKYQEKLAWFAKTAIPGVSIGFFVNEKTKSWTIIELSEDVACVLSAGTGNIELSEDEKI